MCSGAVEIDCFHVSLYLVKFWRQQYMLTGLTNVAVTRIIEVLSTPTPVIMRNSVLKMLYTSLTIVNKKWAVSHQV